MSINDLNYHLEHALEALTAVKRDAGKLKVTIKEKDEKIKKDMLVGSVIRQICKEHIPKEYDLTGEISKRVKYLDFMRLMGETHKIDETRPLATIEELKIWETIQAETQNKIDSFKLKLAAKKSEPQKSELESGNSEPEKSK